MLTTISTIALIVLATAIMATIADPKAKLLLASAVERAARWSVRELRARAAAQSAARAAWQTVYQESREAGQRLVLISASAEK